MTNVSAPKDREAVESFLSGKLAHVNVSAIEKELKKLWQEAASGDGQDHPQVIRACSCNLILFSDREDAESTDATLLDEVVLRNPSRAMLVINREGGQNKSLDAWVTARCHMTPGAVTKQICSEQITVLSQEANEMELLSVVKSLMLGDLPVYIWWRLDMINGDQLGPFLEMANRVIVDSARAPYSFRYLRHLNSLVESTTGDSLAIGDLNWQRLHGARRAIANEFERAPLSPADLKKIDSLVVSTSGQDLQEDDCSLQALLLVGWFADRLGWEPLSLERNADKKSVAKFGTTDGGEVNVRFRSTPFNHVGPGGVFDLEVKLSDGRTLTVSRDPSGEMSTLLATVKANNKVEREVVADDVSTDEPSLVCAELEEVYEDQVFAGALSKAYDLIRLICE